MSAAVRVNIYQAYDEAQRKVSFSFQQKSPNHLLVMETQAERLDERAETAFIRGNAFDAEHLFKFYRSRGVWLAAYPYWEYRVVYHCRCGESEDDTINVKAGCPKCGERPSQSSEYRLREPERT